MNKLKYLETLPNLKISVNEKIGTSIEFWLSAGKLLKAYYSHDVLLRIIGNIYELENQTHITYRVLPDWKQVPKYVISMSIIIFVIAQINVFIYLLFFPTVIARVLYEYRVYIHLRENAIALLNDVLDIKY